MKLIELVSVLDTLNPDHIIFAEAQPAWKADSRVVLGPSDVEGALLEKREGLPYFLEVWLAREVLEVWSRWRNGQVPSDAEKVAALIHYATWDAYQSVD